MLPCCHHDLFAHQAVRAAPLLRLTFAAHDDEAFGFARYRFLYTKNLIDKLYLHTLWLK